MSTISWIKDVDSALSQAKATHNPQPLGAAAKLLKEIYPDSEWTRKASVWIH